MMRDDANQPDLPGIPAPQEAYIAPTAPLDEADRANQPSLPGIPAPARLETGVLPCQELEVLVAREFLHAERRITPDQIQPASVDLRLGAKAWRVRASFLPGRGARVASRLADAEDCLDLQDGAVFEKNRVYVVELQERARLPRALKGFANPKSSTGRLDVFTRLIVDGATSFDRVPAGYFGPLYAEIAPRTFDVLAREGYKLCQLRLRRGSPDMPNTKMRELRDEVPLVDSPSGSALIHDDRVAITLDLEPSDGIAGFRARKDAGLVDIDSRGRYDPRDFWEPVPPRAGGGIVLEPDDFHILATVERVRIPPGVAAEMVAYDATYGELRVHYAGFFDPGFGYGPGPGAKAVLEVRSRDVPFVLDHDQIIGWLRFEKLAAAPDRLYGDAVGSSYQNQGLKLGKQFRPWPPDGI